MHSAGFRSTFLRLLKFSQIKNGGSNFWGKPILWKVWIIWSPLLCFNFKWFTDTNSSSFIRFQWISLDWGLPFSDFWNFYKLKSGGSTFWWKPILQKVWMIWSPILYFNFKTLKDPNSSSFITFQCILHDPGVYFSYF